MKIFDTHAHYLDDSFLNDLENIISDFKNNNIKNVCNITASAKDIFEIKKNTTYLNDKLKKDDIHIYYSFGIHPDEINDFEIINDKYNNFYNFVKENRDDDLIAIGEIGLDYYGDHKDDVIKKKQIEYFAMQIEVAKAFNLPINVHSRNACEDTLDIISNYKENLSCIIHCFSYEKEIAKKYIDMGFYIGIGGVLTFKNGRKLKEVVKYIPLEYLVTETDSPYLAPMPNRGKRNDSRNIKYIINEIANIKNMGVEEVAEILYNNALKVYKIYK